MNRWYLSPVLVSNSEENLVFQPLVSFPNVFVRGTSHFCTTTTFSSYLLSLCLCLSFCLSVSLSLSLSLYPSIYISIYLSIYLLTYLSKNLSESPSFTISSFLLICFLVKVFFIISLLCNCWNSDFVLPLLSYFVGPQFSLGLFYIQ